MTPYQKLMYWSVGVGIVGVPIAYWFGLRSQWQPIYQWTVPIVFGVLLQGVHFSSMVEAEPLIASAGKSRSLICATSAFWILLVAGLGAYYLPKAFSGLPSGVLLVFLLAMYPSFLCLTLAESAKVSMYPGAKKTGAGSEVFGTRASHTKPGPVKSPFWKVFWRMPPISKPVPPTADIKEIELEISDKWRRDGIIK